MVLKLYGHTLSPPSKLVAAVLFEKNIQFKYISIDLLTGEQKKPEYLAIQPWGEVPCIDDDGLILYESRAICQYLDEKYSSNGIKLIPTDVQKRARYDQATFSETSQFNAYAYPLIAEALWSESPNPQKIKDLGSTIATKLDTYEKILAKQRYVAGDEFTLADLYFVPVGEMLPEAGFNGIQERPNVAKWFKEISSRPAWLKVKDGLDFLL